MKLRLIVTLLVVLLHDVLLAVPVPTVLPLHRLSVPKEDRNLASLQARDELRHARLFGKKAINYSLGGTFDPLSYGLYYVVVKLGTPPREFKLQIDTGSDLTWVECKPCRNCLEANFTPSYVHPFEVTQSSTASFISCPQYYPCSVTDKLSSAGCPTNNNWCKYRLEYFDGSSTLGYFLSDMVNFTTIVPNGTSNRSARIVFGCGFRQYMFSHNEEIDISGIMGLSNHKLSITTQLVDQGIIPNVFSHCLRGDVFGGGSLVLGEISEPNITYTPLQKHWTQYIIRMESMTLNGRELPICINVCIDSGSTLGYLATEVFDPLIAAISSGALNDSTYTSLGGDNCYILSNSSSVSDTFPEVHLNFVGGATMFLQPQDYMLLMDGFNGTKTWCLGFKRATNITILGDIVLKDKIIEYDVVHDRLGIAKYDCALPLKISSSGSQTVKKSSYLISIILILIAIFC